MKCQHCGYIDTSVPDNGDAGEMLCPHCGNKLTLDIAEPIDLNTKNHASESGNTPELKVAKAVHVGFGDFVGNLAANVTISGSTAKDVSSPTQTKLTINLRELELDDTSGASVPTDDMLLGVDSVYGTGDSEQDDENDIVDYYTEIQRGFDERQHELDELESQLRQREKNIAEQEQRLEEEIRLNREAAEDYLSAKKKYETQNNIPSPRIIPAREIEKIPSTAYFHFLLRILGGISVLLFIIVLCLLFSMQKMNRRISLQKAQIIAYGQTDLTDRALIRMHSDYETIREEINQDANTQEEIDKQIHVMEDFLSKYEQKESMSGMAEILSIKQSLNNCKAKKKNFELQQITTSPTDKQEK